MVANYVTQPLQGELSYKFRDQIMGVVPMATIMGDHRSVLDVKSEGPVVLDKLQAKINNPDVPGILRDSARPKGAHKKKRAVGHQSWSDVVKSTPGNDLGNSRQSINKR
jgi:hypothetical protein